MVTSATLWYFLVLVAPILMEEDIGAVSSSAKKNSLIRLPPDYVRTHPPISANKSLNISIDIGLWAIREISASSMDMEVDLLVYVIWQDHRVHINKSMAKAIGGRIPVGDDGPKLWMPVLQFRNCRGCKPLNLNPSVYLIHYETELESFWTVVRTISKFSCNIDLRAFPMDRQNCKIQLENYYEDTSKVDFSHQHAGPYKFLSGLELSEFEILDIVPGDCTATYGTNSFACLEVEVRLARVMGYHLTTTYAPTILIVVVSWISFWLPVQLAPARITLGVTSLLTLATRLDQAQRNLPAVSYVKAIDIWMFACIFPVFASLVEFAFAYYMMASKQNAVNPSTKTSSDCQSEQSVNNNKATEKDTDQDPDRPLPPKRNTTVDGVSKIVFPGSFIVFNICYWSKYLSNYYDD